MREDEKDKAYERFLENRAYYAELAKHNITSYDKALLALSSGALGISIAFIDKIGGVTETSYRWVVGVSWLFYLVAILANLQSYRTGWQDATHEIECMDKTFKGEGKTALPTNVYRERTTRLNTLAFLAFAAGTIALCTFALLNMEVT